MRGAPQSSHACDAHMNHRGRASSQLMKSLFSFRSCSTATRGRSELATSSLARLDGLGPKA
jgi:hypothetical protein